MRELRHPLSGALYGLDAETGLLRVEHEGRLGLFTYMGEWKSGDKLQVDPQFCNWVGGPQVESKYNKPFKSV